MASPNMPPSTPSGGAPPPDFTAAVSAMAKNGVPAHEAYCPPEYRHIVPPSEVYVIDAMVGRKNKDRTWIIVLTKTHYYKVEPTWPHKTAWRKDLKEINSVERLENDPLTLKLFYKEFGIMAASKKVLGGAKGFQEREFVFQDKQTCDDWMLAVNKVLRDLWQLEFEAHIVPEPEIYQWHGDLMKVNRKGKKQERMLVISNEKLYNVDTRAFVTTKDHKEEKERDKAGASPTPDSAAVRASDASGGAGGDDKPEREKALKWSFPLNSLSKVQVNMKDPLAVSIFVKQEEGRGLLSSALGKIIKPCYVFMCRDANERNTLIAELTRCFYQNTGEHLAEEWQNVKDP